ncbi:MAG: UDP-3-O-(3-hydroxymyristoyl)glucosamine N-acyltransferase [Planctomycetota bacterium]
MNVSDIAALVRGDVEGNPNIAISGVAKIEEGGPETLVFLGNIKFEKYLESTRAGAVLVARDKEFKAARKAETAWIRVDDPYIAFIRCIAFFRPPLIPFDQSPGIHKTAVVGENLQLASGVSIGAHVVIGNNVKIGKDTLVMPGVKIGASTTIGDNCILFPNAVVFHEIVIGNRVILHSGSVIGMDGFGFAKTSDGRYEKFPQVGNVVIEDDVEVGPNSTIARGAIGATRIQKGCKFDAHVHIAHNCNIGENCAFAAGVGIAGSTKIGKRVVFAGQSGAAGHIEIADDVSVLSKSAVLRSFTTPGMKIIGYPARENARRNREWAASKRLPDLLQEFKKLKKELDDLKSKLK